jgi:hypothetical protein
VADTLCLQKSIAWTLITAGFAVKALNANDSQISAGPARDRFRAAPWTRELRKNWMFSRHAAATILLLDEWRGRAGRAAVAS